MKKVQNKHTVVSSNKLSEIEIQNISVKEECTLFTIISTDKYYYIFKKNGL